MAKLLSREIGGTILILIVALQCWGTVIAWRAAGRCLSGNVESFPEQSALDACERYDRRVWESPATSTLQTETVTWTPILRGLRRSVLAVARPSHVPASERPGVRKSVEAKTENSSWTWLAAKQEAKVRSSTAPS